MNTSTGLQRIFNPEHDLCIANNNAHFVPPASALTFGRECQALTQWLDGLSTGNEPLRYNIVPWGWNKVLRCQLLKQGVAEQELPTEAQLETLRALSHRQLAAQALAFIQERLPQTPWPVCPVFATSLPQVESLAGTSVHAYPWVLKAPWSGSGRGLRWGCGPLLKTDKGWCTNHIAQQGSVLMEPRYHVVQDFAMLFYCGSDISFLGYSLFHTKNGVYQGNTLASNTFIEKHLSQWVPTTLLHQVRQALTDFLRARYVSHYQGYLGVDQFIYTPFGAPVPAPHGMHPCVEINVRMTMGLVARHLYDTHMPPKWCAESQDGKSQLVVAYRPDSGTLQRAFQHAFSLCPVDQDTHYGLFICPTNIAK